jgi:hypothetical protein
MATVYQAEEINYKLPLKLAKLGLAGQIRLTVAVVR